MILYHFIFVLNIVIYFWLSFDISKVKKTKYFIIKVYIIKIIKI